MSETVRAQTAPAAARPRTVSAALGLNGRYKIPGYRGHVPLMGDSFGIRYAEATRQCLTDFDTEMERSRTMTRSYITGTNDLPHIPDEPQKIKMSSKIPGFLDYSSILYHNLTIFHY